MRPLSYIGLLQSFVSGLPRHFSSGASHSESFWRRAWSQWGLLIQSSITAEDYYEFLLDGLHSDVARREYLGTYKRWRWMSRLNAPSCRVLTENKLVFHRYMRGVGLPLPTLMAVVNLSSEDVPSLTSRDAIKDWLQIANGHEEFFVKPVEGAKGGGILAVGKRLDEFAWERVPGGVIDIDSLVQELSRAGPRNALLIEQRLRSHEVLQQFADNVLHTIRLIVGVTDDGPRVFFAGLRVGRGDLPNDNASTGGMMSAVDVETGCLGPLASRASDGRWDWLKEHPVSRATVEGVCLPFWPQTVALAKAAAIAIPQSAMIGWDVAITNYGPVLLEGNDLWDFQFLQMAHRRGLLGGELRDFLERQGMHAYLGLV